MRGKIVQLALVFPGQGAQYPGMGQDLARDFPAARAVLDEIDDACRCFDPALDLPGLMASSTPQELLRTDLCQAVVFAHAAMAWAALEREVRSILAASPPVAVLGHSFGELTAHLAARTLDLASMSALVLHRGRLLLEAPEGALLNVEDVDRRKLSRLLRDHRADRQPGEQVYLAISQAPRLHAVGGLPDGVADFASFLGRRGVSCRPVVGVHKPLHTPFQSAVRARFHSVLSGFRFGLPQFPVVSTARAAFHVAGRAVQELAAQIDSEMRFSQAVERMAKRNPDLYVVLGPGSKVAELLAHYNGIPPERIRVVERSAQLWALVAELARRPAAPPRGRRSRETGWTYARRILRGFDDGQEGYLLLEPDGHLGPFEQALERSGVLIFYKGSFNPIHAGHVALFEAARRRHPGAFATFSLSVHTNKKHLARNDLLFRARLILRAGYPVVLGRSGYFADNVAWLRARAPWLRLVFPAGADALRRLVEYYSPEDFAARFSNVLFEHAARELETHPLPQPQDHPAYAGFRRLQLDPKFHALSSSEIRAWASAGLQNLVCANVPAGTAELFLRRSRQRP